MAKAKVAIYKKFDINKIKYKGKMSDYIDVTETNAYSCLNNFTHTPFVDNNGVCFNTLINAYYYYMSEGHPLLQTAIRHAKGVERIIDIIGFEKYTQLAKPFRHAISHDLNKTNNLLHSLILSKLIQNPDCITILLLTYKKEIRILNKHDAVLGCGHSRIGLNLTGKVLMDLREQFRLERQNANIRTMIKSVDPYNTYWLLR
jgi:predicted NAD-dependent protein-ADP-ribosyltransferase YbiA (DUF1768 family)